MRRVRGRRAGRRVRGRRAGKRPAADAWFRAHSLLARSPAMSFLKRFFRDPETLANESATRELEKAAEQNKLKVKLLLLGTRWARPPPAGGAGFVSANMLAARMQALVVPARQHCESRFNDCTQTHLQVWKSAKRWRTSSWATSWKAQRLLLWLRLKTG